MCVYISAKDGSTYNMYINIYDICIYVYNMYIYDNDNVCLCIHDSAKDGSTYSGDWRDGKRHGSGILEVRVVVS